MSDKITKITIPTMQLYSNVTSILKIWDNVRKDAIKNCINSIFTQVGTVENPVDWSNPDNWINERLSSEDKKIAFTVWDESEHSINPRYMHRLYHFINTHSLLLTDSKGVYHLSTRGNAFLGNDMETIRQIDDKEGILDLLEILSAKKSAKISDLLPDWNVFLSKFFKYGKAQTSQEMLRSRLFNLIERKFVTKERSSYSITPLGFEYRKATMQESKITDDVLKQSLNSSIQEYNQSQREKLRKKLQTIDPFLFEHLVRDLLEQMGYEDVQVTRQTGDQGIDVKGTFRVGISTITEVVQVKRHQSNISRPILDQLRGSLHYYNAIRGTIITTSKFTKECLKSAFSEKAAPISLIDSELLLDLLIEHQIGISKQQKQVIELDDEYFKMKQEEISKI
jgi:restriction system protein